MRKIISALLVLTLILGMAISVSAADQTPSKIVVEGAANTQYGAYRVLDAVIGEDRNAIVYSINENFVDFFFPNGQPSEKYITTVENANAVTYNGTTYYLNITGTANTDPNRVIDSVNSEGNVANLAADLMEYITENTVQATDYKKISSMGTSTEFVGLPIGYYLIDSGAGALCALTTNNQQYKIIEKNEVPTVAKTVSTGNSGSTDVSTYTYSDYVSAQTGDTVYFKVSTTVVNGQEKVILLDIFNTADLELKSTKIVYTSPDGSTTNDLVEDTDYTNELSYPAAGASQLNIDIINSDLIEEGATFDVYLTMKMLASHNTTNTVRLYYTSPIQNPSSDSAYVYSYGFNLNKVDQNKNALSGAQFILSTDSGTDFMNNSTYDEWVLFNSTDNVYTAGAEVPTGGQPAFVTPATISAGSVTINGLRAGTYYLHERTAPDGYNKLTAPITIKIEDDFENMAPKYTITYPDGTVESIDSAWVDSVDVDVVNQSGAVLPSTGGMGTTLFYILGGLMAVSALVILVTNKRMRT